IMKKRYAILWDAARVIAAPQVRKLGTIGGNLCSAVPSADTAPPLIVAGASLNLIEKNRERTLPVEVFFKGPGESVLDPSEILKEIILPHPPEHSGGAYLKLMRRNALDLALVGVAVWLRLDADRKVCKEARIALGAVAPTPIRARKAENALINHRIDEIRAAEAGEAASREASPITDIRATKEYRTEMIKVLTKRAVMKAFERTGAKGAEI
ncbi:MAG: FAD binding domain-containing protein, partial [Deltaproteobacteria bacterium]|nr:FAD binding domain-containing protein [Deltaproteobacteria bacterium]